MKKEKQSTLDIGMAKSKKSCEGGCKCADIKVHSIKSLDIQYDVRNIKIISIDGALIDVSDGEGKILFYSTPLLKEHGVSLIQCPFEVRMKRSVLLALTEDLLNQTTAFLKEEKSKMSEESRKKRPPEVMFS